MSEATEYQGFERDLMFVRRFQKNPGFDDVRDRRREVETPRWNYCCERYFRFWKERGEPHRCPPRNYRDRAYENAVGWFFPKIWIEEGPGDGGGA